MSKIPTNFRSIPSLAPNHAAAPAAPSKSAKADSVAPNKDRFESKASSPLRNPNSGGIHKPNSIQRSLPTKNVGATASASTVSATPPTSGKVTTDPVQREAIMDGLEGLEKASARSKEFKNPINEGIIFDTDKPAGQWQDMYSHVGDRDAAKQLDAALIRPNGDPVTNGDIDKTVEEYAAAREKDPNDGFRHWTRDQKAEWKEGASDFLKARRDSNSVLKRRHSKPEGLPSLPFKRGEFNKPASAQEKTEVREKLDTWKAKEKAAIRREARANGISEDSIPVKTRLDEVDNAAEAFWSVYNGERDYGQDRNGPNVRKIYREELDRTGGDVIAAHRRAAIYQRPRIARKGTDIGAHP